MNLYSFNVADMEVALLCNGLDNLIKNLPYEGKKAESYDEADAIILFSVKEDKAVQKAIEKMDEEGVNAGLVILITAGDKKDISNVIDMNIMTKEPYLGKALSSVFTMLDYYTHINSVDVGYELADSGSFGFVPPADNEVFGLISQRVSENLSDTKEALLLLEVGEDIWVSEIDGLCNELSELSPETEITVFAARTLEGGNVKTSLFKK